MTGNCTDAPDLPIDIILACTQEVCEKVLSVTLLGRCYSMDSLGPIDTEMSTMEVTSSTGVGGGGGTSKGSEVREVTLPEDQSGPEDAQEPAVEARVATKLAKNKKKKGRNVGSGGEGGKTGGGIRTKSRYQCQLCPKQYPTQKLLDKHVMFHVDQNAACSQCGKLFYKRWMLEQVWSINHSNYFQMNDVLLGGCLLQLSHRHRYYAIHALF